MRLSEGFCDKIRPGKTRKKISDGGGLQLWVSPGGSKIWRLAHRYSGRQRLLRIGSHPQVSLCAARQKREDIKRDLKNRFDPKDEGREANLARLRHRDTFEIVSKEYIEKLKAEKRAISTISKTAWLLRLACDEIGQIPIAMLTPAEILTPLKRVERLGKYETANRMRATIGAVCRYAVATARAQHDPTYILKGALVSPRTISRAAIIEERPFGLLLQKIHTFEKDPVSCAGLKLMAYLFQRPGELRKARWDEFDFTQVIWTLPRGNTKMRRPHKSPLSRQAIAILKDLRILTGHSELVFPSPRSKERPISDSAMNTTLRKLGVEKHLMSSHGFRASAATLLNESGKWHSDAIERQLSHIDPDKVRRAYCRGDYWDERVRMIQWWADYTDDLRDRTQ